MIAASRMLRRGVEFADLGAAYLDRNAEHRMAKRLARRPDALGCEGRAPPKATIA